MNYYYLNLDKKPCGPQSLDSLCEMAEQGQISPFVLVAKEGDAAWRPLSLVAKEQGRELKIEGSLGACPTCENSLSLLPDGTLLYACPHCGRALRPAEGKENNLWYNFTLALRQYAKFSGRATRQEYWSYVLFSAVLSIVPCLLVGMVAMGVMIIDAEQGDEVGPIGMILLMIAYILNYGVSLFFLLPSYAVWARRLHDVGWSAKWILGFFALLLLALICLVIGSVAASAGDEGPGVVSILLWCLAGISYLGVIGIAILSMVLSFFDSQRGPNKYGPSRKYPLG